MILNNSVTTESGKVIFSVKLCFFTVQRNHLAIYPDRFKIAGVYYYKFFRLHVFILLENAFFWDTMSA